MPLTAEIKKKLGHFTLDVSFACTKGKILSIVGPSGSGKTTILRIIAGLDAPDEGSITCGERTWVNTGCRVALPTRKRRLAMVFQDFVLFPHCSVLGNVCFAARDKALAEALMKRFDIWHLKNSRPQSISGGERQRAAICQALASEPEVLLLDEPFSALDPLTRRKLRMAVAGLKSELGIPIIHVTHDIKEALFLGDEIVPVVQGKVFHKWLLQFMLTAREAGLCPDRGAGDSERDVELEMYDSGKEY
jgi:molybdate transport system ATP-binding protein